MAKNDKKRSTFVIITDHKDRVLLWKDKGMWTLPGGTVEAGETKKQAAKRETLEEVGINVQKLKNFAIYYNRNQHKNFYYRAEGISSKIAKTFESEEIKFVKPKKLPDFLPPKHCQAIVDFQNNTQGFLIHRNTNYLTTKDYRKHYKLQKSSVREPKGHQIILAR